MKIFTRILPKAVASMFLIACEPGGAGPEKDNAFQGPGVPQSFENSGKYVLEDVECAYTDGQKIEKASFFQYQQSRVFLLEGDSPLDGRDSLTGPYINGTTYGLKTISNCSGSADSSCGGEFIEDRGALLRTCRSLAKYERLALEGIAITGATHVNNALQFFASLPSAPDDIGAVHLMVMPERKTQKPGGVEVRSDNLSYSTSFGTWGPTITIYPKGEFGDYYWENVNIWESSWVLAHEAGHHVFNIMLTNAMPEKLTFNSISLREDHGHHHEHEPILSWPHKHSDDINFSLTAASRTVTEREVRSAVNEAFADLFAYYAAGLNKGITHFDLVNRFRCFESSRDVTFPYFKDGTRKYLNSTIIGEFFANVQGPPQPCFKPDYQDVHAIGAIIAHGMYRLFDVSTPPGQQNPGLVKGDLSLQWASNIPAALGNYNGVDEARLRKMIEAGIKVVSKDVNTLTAEQCQVLKEVFPTWKAYWDSNETFTCQ